MFSVLFLEKIRSGGRLFKKKIFTQPHHISTKCLKSPESSHLSIFTTQYTVKPILPGIHAIFQTISVLFKNPKLSPPGGHFVVYTGFGASWLTVIYRGFQTQENAVNVMDSGLCSLLQVSYHLFAHVKWFIREIKNKKKCWVGPILKVGRGR